MATGENTYHEDDGKSVLVDLTHTVTAFQVAVVEGWLGITADKGDSGDTIALISDRRCYQFTVPSGLAATKGAIVYIDITDLTGHAPDDSAYGLSAGSNKVAFFKCIEDQDGTLVSGILLGQLAS